jgi:hypothetical protein
MPIGPETNAAQLPALAVLATHGAKLPVVLPLVAACVFLLASIPRAASRGKFHVPGYGGIAILAFACAVLLGRLSGARGITGTIAGISLAILFFLLMAIAAGCVLALFSFRPPLEE